jgi:hypothetical protein
MNASQKEARITALIELFNSHTLSVASQVELFAEIKRLQAELS